MRGPPQSAGVAGALRAWAGFAVLVGAQFGVRPLIAGRATVDFAVIAVLFSAVRLRPGVAAVVGFLTGLALDALSPGGFGASALVLTVLAFSASWLKAVFFADHVALTGLFVFSAKWLFDVAMALLTGVGSGASMLVALLVWSPLSAALTAVVGVLLLVVFRPLYRPHSL
ncbi:rod shape-determining protein MreD [Gemmatimonas sp.]|jgi:rod shape-determining protein MreD|uniref:rod shape-determining protein MreD n=1 Tax=Gemmatimonas sp. TaxID=1962908 RepID=UPI0037BE710B